MRAKRNLHITNTLKTELTLPLFFKRPYFESGHCWSATGLRVGSGWGAYVFSTDDCFDCSDTALLLIILAIVSD